MTGNVHNLFEGADPAALEAQFEAASIVAETMRVLHKSGSNTVAEILRTGDEFIEWQHMPRGDVFDRENASQYYYHAHSKKPDRPSIHDDEHGHFHCFLRGPAIDRQPAPGQEVPEKPGDIAAHIIGIGMDAKGVPIRLFTTNRWVTGELWYPAEDMIAMLDRFDVDLSTPSWPLNLWLTNIVRLYRPEIVRLLRQRDEAVARWAEEHEGDVFEDRGLEVTSALDIDLAARVEALEEAYQG
ncbi:DUF6969 family protein [Parvularcula lutaonensis]|uniref:DUF6969 family protein n=1 Tax=Parvularcula lutaonensis TaxID=491923 RepID=A0ABV7M841_9PROT|nr:hypothetical protein [Parvularcula lutaonensis]GGY42936.1 hypothetical protein GCM10007148_09520 [Parvularcula lutaonensis]